MGKRAKGQKGRKGTRAQGQKGKRAHGHTSRRADGQKARRPEQGQTQSLHTLTVLRQAATTSFPLVCPSHLSLGGAAFSLLLSGGATFPHPSFGWCCCVPPSFRVVLLPSLLRLGWWCFVTLHLLCVCV